MHLCDTNVVSELARPAPDPGVLSWAAGVTEVALSVVTLDEIRYGLAWRPIPRIIAWFDRFLESRCEILPFTADVAELSGRLRGRLRARGETRTQADMMIAATARFHGLTLVTRNVADFESCGVSLLNPFARSSAP